MLLPNINFKLNLDPKHVVFGALGVCSIGICVFLGYSLALQPAEVVCKNYIRERDAAKAAEQAEREAKQRRAQGTPDGEQGFGWWPQ